MKWATDGLREDGGGKIAGHLSVDATSVQSVKEAVFLCEGLIICGALADAWVESNGAWWDVAPGNPRNGHCMAITGYDADGVWLNTWGLRIKMTWPALAQFASPANGGSCNAVLSLDFISKATAKAPTGLDWAALQAVFPSLGAVA